MDELVVLEACAGCADQIAGELLSRLSPAGLERRWETVDRIAAGRVDALRSTIDWLQRR